MVFLVLLSTLASFSASGGFALCLHVEGVGHLLAGSSVEHSATHTNNSVGHCAGSKEGDEPCFDVLLDGLEWAHQQGSRGGEELSFDVAVPGLETAGSYPRSRWVLTWSHAPPDLLRLKALAVEVCEVTVLRV